MSTTIYHKHHIIPRHMGGSDDPENLVSLTIEEHAEAHKVLYEQYGKIEDQIAYRMLSGQISSAEASTLARKHRDTSYMKTIEYRNKISKANKGKTPWNKGKRGVQKFSEEVRLKKSELNKGSKNPNSKRIEYKGKVYNTIKDCIDENNISHYKLKRHPSFKYVL